MPISKDKSNPANQEYWRFVEETSRDLEKWPAWLRAEPSSLSQVNVDVHPTTARRSEHILEAPQTEHPNEE